MIPALNHIDQTLLNSIQNTARPSMKYLDQNTVDECRDALRQGCELNELAGKLRIEPQELARILGLRISTPVDDFNPFPNQRPHTKSTGEA